MKREQRDFREQMPRPVQRVPLEETPRRWRVIALAAALVIAGLALFIALRTLTRVDSGWQQLQADTADGPVASVALWADLGAGEASPLSERRALTTVYSRAARELYTLFTPYEIVSGVQNLWWINHHPEEELEVDARLYRALRLAADAGGEIFLGPVYALWDSVYFSSSDGDASQADPRLDGASAEAVAAFLPLLSSREHISLRFPAENTVCLHISPELRAMAEEYGVDRFLDFGWMTDAFLTDALAEALLSAGFTRAALVSPDGFIRLLDGRAPYTLEVLSARQGNVVRAADAEYQGPAALLRLVPKPGGDRPRAYRYADGTLRSAWISPLDGLDHAPVDGLCAIAPADGRNAAGCAELLMRVLPLLREEFTEERLRETAGTDVTLLAVRGEDILQAGEGFQLIEAGAQP